MPKATKRIQLQATRHTLQANTNTAESGKANAKSNTEYSCKLHATRCKRIQIQLKAERRMPKAIQIQPLATLHAASEYSRKAERRKANANTEYSCKRMQIQPKAWRSKTKCRKAVGINLGSLHLVLNHDLNNSELRTSELNNSFPHPLFKICNLRG